MKTGITRSVGRMGINNKDDVMFVQSALNTHAKKHASSSTQLKVDGICGAKTAQAIHNYQKNHVGIALPDGRIDPNGRTFRHLTGSQIASTTTPHPILSNNPIAPNFSGVNVTYASDIKENRRVVSAYAINVVKLALLESGMTHAVITSTLRTPEDQAEIMYKNAKNNFSEQFNLYGSAGQAVLNIYKNNKTKNKDDVVNFMKEKIEALLKEGKKTSKHCVTLETFKTLNTFDIGARSTEERSRNFDKKALTKAFHTLQKQGYIQNFIDETMLKNNCWHLEITPNTKNINLYKKESMLSPFNLISRQYV